MDSGDVTVLRMEWEDDPTAWGRSSSPCARPSTSPRQVLSDGRRLVHEEGDGEDKFRAWYRLGARGQWRSLMLPRDKCPCSTSSWPWCAWRTWWPRRGTST